MKGFIFVLCVLIIVSCKSDDPKPVSKIVGHWTAVSFDVSVSREGKELILYLKRVYGIDETTASALADDIHNSLVREGKLIGELYFKVEGRFWLGSTDEFTEGKWKLLNNGQYVQLESDLKQIQNVLISKLDDENLVLSFDRTQAVGLPTGTLQYLILMTFKRVSK